MISMFVLFGIVASEVGKNSNPYFSMESVDPDGNTLYRGLINVSGGRYPENISLIDEDGFVRSAITFEFHKKRRLQVAGPI